VRLIDHTRIRSFPLGRGRRIMLEVSVYGPASRTISLQYRGRRRVLTAMSMTFTPEQLH
jgi:hypothetical protein